MPSKFEATQGSVKMVDISIEVLASSVPIKNGFVYRYRIKTWWAHVDVPPDKTLVKLPRLPMIQQYLIMTGKDTTVFVETWEDEGNVSSRNGGELREEDVTKSRPRFLGMTTCSLDEQLKNPTLNPTVQWLDVWDPVENILKGKLLLKLDAKFALPNSRPSNTNAEEIVSEKQSAPMVSELFRNRNFSHHQLKGTDSPLGYRDSSKDIFNSGLSNQSQSQSDASVVSVISVPSSRSQDQGVQTDFSLPILSCEIPERQPINARSLNSASEEKKRNYSCSKQLLDYQNRKLPPLRSILDQSSSNPIVDPLKIAEAIILRGENARKSSKNAQSPIQHSKNVAKKSHPHQKLQSEAFSRHALDASSSSTCDMEAIGDVIDVLNSKPDLTPSEYHHPPQKTFAHPEGHHQRGKGKVFNAGNQLQMKQTLDGRKNADPLVRQGSISDPAKVRLAPEGRSALHKELRNVGDRSLSDNSNYIPRFKEIHFDGLEAQQHASDYLLKTHGMDSTNLTEKSKNDSLPPQPGRRKPAANFGNFR